MKLTTKLVALACLGVFTLFAGSALAQEDQASSDQGTPARQLQIPPQFRQPKPINGIESAPGKTQEQMKAEAVGSDHTNSCTYTFTSGSKVTYLQFCVTVDGNIAEFQSPVGIEQIRQGSIGEGYGICDMSTDVGYYDFADNGDSGNWKAPTTVTHTASMVKIARTTSDGLWTLTQTITSVAGTPPYAKVLMALKNNSSSAKEAFVFRWADADPGAAAETDTSFLENFDGTYDSAWGYDAYAGLMYQDVGNPVPASVPYLRAGFALNLVPTDPCDATSSAGSPITDADGAILYLWLVALNKEQSVSVTGRYVSF